MWEGRACIIEDLCAFFCQTLILELDLAAQCMHNKISVSTKKQNSYEVGCSRVYNFF